MPSESQKNEEKTSLLTDTDEKYGSTISIDDKAAAVNSSVTLSTLGAELEQETNATPSNCCSLSCIKTKIRQQYKTHSLLVLILVAILLAYLYPPIGAHYLFPKVTATWIAVMMLFVISGISLKTEDLSKASQRMGFNMFVQFFNYVIVSLVVMALSRSLIHAKILPRNLADGMLICSCLPCTISMIVVLTNSANGDEAAAVFAAIFGVMTGAFCTPGLVLTYLGVKGGVDIVEVLMKLSLRVLLPLLVGQLLQRYYAPTQGFVAKHKKRIKSVQEWCLAYIVYSVFCQTFEAGVDTTAADIGLMIFLQVFVVIFIMALAWACLGVFFPDEPKLRVTGLFACTQKTVSMGIPLIKAIYENDPNAGLYTLPLIVWHPMQLVIGSTIVPSLVRFVEREEIRLGRNSQIQQKPPSDSVV